MKIAQIHDLVINALEDLKAIDITFLNVSELTPITDEMIFCSGTSNRHVKAIAENLIEEAKHNGMQPLGVSGKEDAEWVLVDLADVVVHIMLPEAREYYQLEKLWSFKEEKHNSQKSTDAS